MQRLRLRSEIGRAATESRLLREREREGEEREGRETVDGFEAERKIGTLATASMDPAEMKLEVRCLPYIYRRETHVGGVTCHHFSEESPVKMGMVTEIIKVIKGSFRGSA